MSFKANFGTVKVFHWVGFY